MSEFTLGLESLRLKDPAERSAVSSVGPRDSEDEDRHGAKRLVCSACRSYITDGSHSLSVDGKHEHVEVNPAGIVYHICCFLQAPGCTPAGNSSGEWSWFPGYVWQIGLCGRCGAHLGWHFQAGDSSFWGLIVDRLEEEQEEE